MTKETLLTIAERNVKKAEKAYEHNYNRQGVTGLERINLIHNVEYAKIVYEMLKKQLLISN